MTATKTKQTFETAYRSLETLVNEMESQNLGLEEGITKFEEGLELAQFCKNRLTQVENKVVTIKKKFADVLNATAPDDDNREPGVVKDDDEIDETQPDVSSDDEEDSV